MNKYRVYVEITVKDGTKVSKTAELVADNQILAIQCVYSSLVNSQEWYDKDIDSVVCWANLTK